eukprot:TRINITY_DN4202_c0_g1_i1.p4 TRINITY_DN4202_c0_g1~~TRINITY_DN4202_c0_g1_i1.p4  ORF type:complete len:147 (-),score=19.32 TRINITY_DN4202_c0_g1_i1:118-558(-)
MLRSAARVSQSSARAVSARSFATFSANGDFMAFIDFGTDTFACSALTVGRNGILYGRPNPGRSNTNAWQLDFEYLDFCNCLAVDCAARVAHARGPTVEIYDLSGAELMNFYLKKCESILVISFNDLGRLRIVYMDLDGLFHIITMD